MLELCLITKFPAWNLISGAAILSDSLDVKTLSFSDGVVEVWPLFTALCVINREIFSYRLTVGSCRICCITRECFINAGVVLNHEIPSVKFNLRRSHIVWRSRCQNFIIFPLCCWGLAPICGFVRYDRKIFSYRLTVGNCRICCITLVYVS